LTATAGAVLENAYLNGDGNGAPLGLFAEHDMGIDSSRDRETATTGIVKADDIIDLVADLPAQYREGAVFIVNREFERRVRKLKDGEGNYIWKTGLDGFGNTLMGHRLYVSEYAPGSTWATGQYVALFGNLSHYWIVDSLNMQVKRLDELYAETDQTGFIFRYEGDGMPVLKQAFMRLKLK
jgi:HK97 family phage major capsid protein